MNLTSFEGVRSSAAGAHPNATAKADNNLAEVTNVDFGLVVARTQVIGRSGEIRDSPELGVEFPPVGSIRPKGRSGSP